MSNHEEGDFDVEAEAIPFGDDRPLPPPAGTGEYARSGRDTQAARVIELAEELDCELFHDADGNAFARVPVGDHHELLEIRQRGFADYLQRHYYEREGSVPEVVERSSWRCACIEIAEERLTQLRLVALVESIDKRLFTLEIPINQFLGGFPVIIPEAFTLESVNIYRSWAIGFIRKLRHCIRQCATIGTPNIPNYPVDIKYYDRAHFNPATKSIQNLPYS